MFHSSTHRRVIPTSLPYDARLIYCTRIISRWFAANYPSSPWDNSSMAHLADMIAMRSCPGDARCAAAIRWILANRPDYYGAQEI